MVEVCLAMRVIIQPLGLTNFDSQAGVLSDLFIALVPA